MKYRITCLIFFLTYFSLAQKDTIYSLFVKEYFKDSTGQSCSRINQYDFVRGIYSSKKEINFNERDRYPSLYPYFIYENRFLIIDESTVLDLKKEKYITSRKGSFIDVKGDSVIIELEKYYYFSLKRKKYFAINDTIYDYLNRDLSPDLAKRIDIIYGKDSNKLTLIHNNAKSQILVNSIGQAQFKSKGGLDLDRYAIKWIDDSSFVYAEYMSYDKFNFDFNYINLYKMKVTDEFPTFIMKIDSVQKSRINSSFSFDLIGNLVFNCQKGEFFIDTKENNGKLIDFEYFGNGFKVDYFQNVSKSNLYYNEKVISTNFNVFCEVKTVSGFIAINTFSDISYNPKFEFLVWNRFTSDWNRFELTDDFELIGWYIHH